MPGEVEGAIPFSLIKILYEKGKSRAIQVA